jgi:hypothetical protein
MGDGNDFETLQPIQPFGQQLGNHGLVFNQDAAQKGLLGPREWQHRNRGQRAQHRRIDLVHSGCSQRASLDAHRELSYLFSFTDDSGSKSETLKTLKSLLMFTDAGRS